MRSPVTFLLLMVMSSMIGVHAEQIEIIAGRDVTLYEDAEGDVANGSGDYLFIGQTGQSPGVALRRTLVRFDVSAIPADAVVTSVEVRFEIDRVPIGAEPGTAMLHRVLADWGEGNSDAGGEEGMGTLAQTSDATWQHRFYDATFWGEPGGDFVQTPSASTPYGENPQTLSFGTSSALRADVQAWVEDPTLNHGWALLGEEDFALSARRLIAQEIGTSQVPRLTVDYSIPSVVDNLVLTPVGYGLGQPVAIANAADGRERLFVVDRIGLIRIIDLRTETVLATPYLDLSAVVDATGGEQGLLGLAFHPDFALNGQFYVYYTWDPVDTDPDRSVVAMYRQSAGNPNIADTTPTVLLEFEQDAANHNGGDLHFGADGYLYIASGDGGGDWDNAQNVNTLKGKILRIDVDAAPGGDGLCGIVKNYGVPSGNAFPGAGDGCDEILHLGLRNPWRFSFDAQTEEMYIGDVGQGSWEEIDHAAPGTAGLNFGWPCFEGTHVFDNTATCPNPVAPIIEYPRLGYPDECAVTGGYVYRGSGTAVAGYYVYGDYCSSRVWAAREVANNWEILEWTAASATLERITAFGQDEFCELYVADGQAGIVYRIDDTERIARSGFEALRCQ